MNTDELKKIFDFLKNNFPEKFEEVFTSFDFFVQNLNNVKNEVSQDLTNKISNGEFNNELFQNAQLLNNFIKDLTQLESNYQSEIQNKDVDNTSEITNFKSQKINYEDYNIDNSKVYYISDDFTNKRPYAFSFRNSEQIMVSKWRDLYYQVCEILIKIDPQKFTDLRFSLKGKFSNAYITYNPSELRKPLKLSCGLYIETNFSANDISRNIRFMFDAFNISEYDFKIYLRADYTPLHN